MKRGIITTLAVLAGWWGAANYASAQFGVLGAPPVRAHPTVSPFINMGGGAFGYYGLVRPELESNRALQQLQQNVNRLNPDGSLQGQLTGNTPAATTGLVTGHSATFFNTGHYFPTAPPVGTGFNAGIGSLGTGLGGLNPTFIGGVGGNNNFGTVRPFFSSNLNTFNR